MNNISEQEKLIIMERLDVLSPQLFFSVGSDNQSFSKNDLIAEIKKNTEIGQDFIKSEMEFIRALKDGTVMKILTS